MRLGLFLILPQPPGMSQRQVFAAALADAVAAERLGFDSVWVTEHHGSGYGLSVAVGYAVNVTPFHPPIRLAEEIATVDQISGGRVIAGFGPGYSPAEFRTMGADFTTRHHTHHNAVDSVIDQWLNGGGVRPHQAPHPPVAVTAAASATASWAARRGYDLLTLGDDEHSARLLAAYRRDARPPGDGVRPGRFGLLRSICAVPPNTAAEPPPVRDAIRWTLDHRNRMVLQAPPTEAQVDEYLRARALIGSPAALRRDLRRLAAAGVDELLCWCRWGMLADRTVHDSMRALAAAAV